MNASVLALIGDIRLCLQFVINPVVEKIPSMLTIEADKHS